MKKRKENALVKIDESDDKDMKTSIAPIRTHIRHEKKSDHYPLGASEIDPLDTKAHQDRVGLNSLRSSRGLNGLQHQKDFTIYRPSTIIFPGLNRQQVYLVDHFLTGITSDLFKLDTNQARFHPLRDIYFSKFMFDELGILTACAYASNHLSKVRNNEVGPEALRLTSATLTLLRQRLQSGNTCTDDMATMAVIGLIAIDAEIWPEIRLNSKNQQLSFHVHGLRTIVQQRGGWVALAKSTVAWHMHWFDIVCSGELSLALTPFSRFHNYARPCRSHLEAYTCELCSFCESLAARRFHPISQLVHRDSFINSILGPREECSQPTHWGTARCATILYLLIVSLELHSPQDTESFIIHIRKKVGIQRLTPESSQFAFLWVLITDFETFQLEFPEGIWMLTRALYVVNRLSFDVRSRLENFLFSNLKGKHDSSGESSKYGKTDGPVVLPEFSDFSLLESDIWHDITIPCEERSQKAESG